MPGEIFTARCSPLADAGASVSEIWAYADLDKSAGVALRSYLSRLCVLASSALDAGL